MSEPIQPRPSHLKALNISGNHIELSDGLRLSEREKIDFINGEIPAVVEGLHGLALTNTPEHRRQARANILSGMLGKLAMVQVPEAGTTGEAVLQRAISNAEIPRDDDPSFAKLYNAYGDHPLVRPIDAAFDVVDKSLKDDAKMMMRGAMMLISKLSDQ